MQLKTKKEYINRIDLAKDLLTNVKNDLKIEIVREQDAGNFAEALEFCYLAHESVKLLKNLVELQMAILEVEKKAKEKGE